VAVQTLRSRTGKISAGEHAKKRLVEAGLDLFGRYSFHGVSTRSLADRADVNLAAIQYYFGSKTGLYQAVASHIVDQVGKWLRPAISEIESKLQTGAPTEAECFDLLCHLLNRLTIKLLGSPDSKKWAAIVMREQMEPTEAFDILYEGLLKPIDLCFFRLVGGTLGLDAQDQETKLRAYAIKGQLLIFHISRAELERSLNWKAYRPEEVEAVRGIVLDHARAILGMLPVQRLNSDVYSNRSKWPETPSPVK